MASLPWIVYYTGILLDLAESFLTWRMHSILISAGANCPSDHILRFLLTNPLIYVKFPDFKSNATG